MDALFTVTGIVLILISLQDQFQSLFHPAGHAVMSDWIARIIWNFYGAIGRGRPGVLTLAGPTAMVTIIILWAVLIGIGGSLIYYPRYSTFLAPLGFDSIRRGPDMRASFVKSEAPTLVEFEGPLYAGGRVWRIELNASKLGPTRPGTK